MVFPVQRRASRIRCQQYGYEVRSAGVDRASALEERTRERVPLDWAMTQQNLGAALAHLGQREMRDKAAVVTQASVGRAAVHGMGGVERAHLAPCLVTQAIHNGLSQRPSSSSQSDVVPTMVGPPKADHS